MGSRPRHQKQNLASRQQHDIRSGGRTGEIDPLGRCGASWLMHTAVRHAPKMPFTDLHSFKDFVTYVQTYLPDRFPPREASRNHVDAFPHQFREFDHLGNCE